MANVRKPNQPTPFVNFKLHEEEARYQALHTEEELAAFYHEMLSKYEGWKYLTIYIYEMIGFSTNMNINSVIPKKI